MNAKNTRHSEWIDQLSDYLIGDLSEADHRAVEDHLSECGGCRRVLEDLREVITRAEGLGDIEPPRDLWGGIAATIQAPSPTVVSDDSMVIALPTAGPHEEVEETLDDQRFTFTAPQLVAASIALVAASALATWIAGPGLGVHGGAPAGLPPSGVFSLASDDVAIPDGLAEELATLEGVLLEAREKLDPNTIRVLERNLTVIEGAIEDSRSALAQDPGNAFLADHLARVYERKLEYLRDVSRVAEWVG